MIGPTCREALRRSRPAAAVRNHKLFSPRNEGAETVEPGGYARTSVLTPPRSRSSVTPSRDRDAPTNPMHPPSALSP